MKKFFVFLCVMFIVLGAVACNDDSETANRTDNDITANSESVEESGEESSKASPVPEPATILLIITGIVALIILGRKTFFKDK